MVMNIEVDVDQKIAKMLDAIKKEGGNLNIPFANITRSWFKSNKSIFLLKSSGKYPDYGGFAPDTIVKYLGRFVTRRVAYKARKQSKLGFVYPMMRGKTKALEQSLTDPTDAGSINLVINNTLLFLGTKVPYAGYHQSPAARKIMPFRPIVFLGVEQLAPPEKKQDYDRMINVFESYLQQVIDNNEGKFA